MLGSEILDVGIGTALFFLLASLIATAAREALEAVFRTRAMDLERGLRTLLSDAAGTGDMTNLFKHPALDSLFHGTYAPDQLRRKYFFLPTQVMGWWARRRFPSYVPAGAFAAALMDIAAHGASPRATPGSGAAPPAANTLTAIRQGVNSNIKSESVRRAILWAIDSAGGDLAKVRQNLEAWFNGAMDRTSGWYRRRTHAILMLIGLGAAVALNLDTLSIVRRLGEDQTLRAAIVAQAERQTAPVAAPPGKDPLEDAVAAKRRVDAVRAQLDQIGFPTGWTGSCPAPQAAALECAAGASPLTWNPRETAALVLGWLMTALAISLGAPFWFDILNKVMVIRSTVKPHEKSPEEASQDHQARS